MKIYFKLKSILQESKCFEQGDEEELDRDHVLLASPDSGKSTDNDIEGGHSSIKISSAVNGSSNHDECDDEMILVKTINENTNICYSRRPIAIVS